MANKIKPRRSYTASSVPLTSDLDTHELAIRWTPSAPAMFTKDASGNIVTVALGGGGSTSVVTAATVSGFPGTGTAGVLYAALDTGRIYEWQGAYIEMGGTGGGYTPWSSVPSSPTASGNAGDIAYDANYLYTATAASTWKRAAWTSWIVDPYFSNVSLLLHADGSGSTFTDSSPTPKTITASGNSTQSATQSKWGGKSLYLDGSSYLSVANNSAFDLAGVDWCIESWLYYTSLSNEQNVLEQFTPDAGPGWTLYKKTDNTFEFFTGSAPLAFSVGPTVSTWCHIAIARTSGTIRAYMDGTLRGTLTGDCSSSSRPLYIGVRAGSANRMTGYVDDLRITKGSGRGYTGSTITVPTAAFPDQ